MKNKQTNIVTFLLILFSSLLRLFLGSPEEGSQSLLQRKRRQAVPS